MSTLIVYLGGLHGCKNWHKQFGFRNPMSYGILVNQEVSNILYPANTTKDDLAKVAVWDAVMWKHVCRGIHRRISKNEGFLTHNMNKWTPPWVRIDMPKSYGNGAQAEVVLYSLEGFIKAVDSSKNYQSHFDFDGIVELAKMADVGDLG